MPFKIVRTLERDGYRLSIIPASWESNGILKWPKTKYISRLVKDEFSEPGSDWVKMRCDVKRQYLPTYALAEQELEVMTRQSETDNNEAYQDPSPKQIPATIMQSFDFDAYADSLTNTSRDIQPHPSNISNPSMNNAAATVNNDSTGEVILQVCGDQNILSEKIETLINTIHNQNKTIENMANKICIMSVQLEDINDKLNRQKDEPMTVTLLKNVNREETESFSYTIIDNKQQLDELELKLSDKTAYKTLKRHFSFLCSSSPGEGRTCAYRLLDTMFSRDFACLCSWSGASRGEISKIPLKNYKTLQKFFFEMISFWDNTFTIEKMEMFFKTALKNSFKRKTIKGLRASKMKCHKTIKKNKKKDNPLQAAKDNNGQEDMVLDQTTNAPTSKNNDLNNSVNDDDNNNSTNEEIE